MGHNDLNPVAPGNVKPPPPPSLPPRGTRVVNTANPEEAFTLANDFYNIDVVAIQAAERARLRQELMDALEPEIRIVKIPGSATEIEVVMISDVRAALDRICLEEG